MGAGLNAGTAYVDLLPRLGKGFGDQIEQSIKGDVDRVGSSAGSSIGGALKKAAAIAAGAFAVAGGVQVFKGFIDQANESREVAAQTATVLKSTGGAARVSAKDVDALANSISAKIGVDDEAIASGENLLLTFTNVQNRVGKGNDIFNQATQVMTDMSSALGQDLKSSAIQLGKALNDPIKGITALQRVGVTFTDQQKEQIQTMVKAGNVAGAQKVILAELSKEFGGSAASQATAGKRLSVVWGNIQEQLGGYLLPILDKLGNWLADRLPGIVNSAVGFVGPLLRTLVLGVQALFAAFRDPDVTSDGFVGVMERIGVALRQAYDAVRPLVQALIDGFTDRGLTEGASGLVLVLQRLGGVLHDLTDWVRDHMTVALIVLGDIILELTSPVLAALAAIALLVVGVIYAYNHFTIFRTIVDGVVAFFSDVLIPAVEKVASYIADQIGHLAAWWAKNWDDIKAATQNVLTAIAAVVAAFIAPFIFIWQHAGDQILAILRIAWDEIQNVISTAVRIIRDIVTFFVALLAGDWGKAWDAIKDIPLAAFDFMKRSIGDGLALIGQIVEGAWNIITGLFSAAWDGLKNLALSGVGFIVDKFLGMVEWIVKAAADAFGWVPGVGSKLREAAVAVEAFRDDVNRSLEGIHKDVEVIVHAKLAEGQSGQLNLGARAGGGPVAAGTPYIVGEKGPELFVPAAAGRIVPNVDVPAASAHDVGQWRTEKTYQLNLNGVIHDPIDVEEQFRRMEWLAG